MTPRRPPDALERVLTDDGAVAGRSPRGGQNEGAVLTVDPGQVAEQVSRGGRDTNTGLGSVESDVEPDIDGDVIGSDGQRSTFRRAGSHKKLTIGPHGVSDEGGRSGGVNAIGRHRGASTSSQETPGRAPGALHDVGDLNGRHTLTFLPCCRTWERGAPGNI